MSFLILLLFLHLHWLLHLIDKSPGIAQHMSAKNDWKTTRNPVQLQEKE